MKIESLLEKTVPVFDTLTGKTFFMDHVNLNELVDRCKRNIVVELKPGPDGIMIFKNWDRINC